MNAALGSIALALLLMATGFEAQAATQVGTTVFARGAASAELDGRVRLVGNGTPIYEGDVVTTAARSFAVIEYKDGTKMTVRPNSVLKVERFEHDEGEESGLLSLFKGGFRAITGLLTKRNPGGLQVQMSVATIGIRGTDFLARICGEDCAEEASRYARKVKGVDPRLKRVGRVAFQQGTLTAVNKLGETRPLSVGEPLYEGDLLETGARDFAVIVFDDETRITLKPGTRFEIERHDYQAEAPEEGSSLLRLFKGGLRAVTGLLAAARPESVTFDTPVATIGIRGTRFDVVCEEDCGVDTVAEFREKGEPPPLALRLLDSVVPAAYAQTFGGLLILGAEGTVFITSKATRQTFQIAGAQFAQLLGGQFQTLATRPPVNLGPPPDQINYDAVKVNEGTVIMEGVELTDGEAGSAVDFLPAVQAAREDDANALEGVGTTLYDTIPPDRITPEGILEGEMPDPQACES